MSDTQGGRSRASDQEILAATPKSGEGKEAQVGVFVLLGLVAFVIVIFWMTDPATLRGRYMLVTEVDHAGGVRAGDGVQMRGINVGRVNGFEMFDDQSVAITLEIEGEWQIPEGSRTIMGEAGLFGGRSIEIVRGDGPGFYAEWDTLPGEGASGSGLLSSVDELSASAESVLQSIEAMLDDETVGSVQGSARELEALLNELSAVTREQRGALGEITSSLQNAAAGLETASAAGPDLARAVARADSAMATLSVTTQSLDVAAASINTILGRVERGEGTLGRLSTDETLYVSLNSAAATLNAFLEDLQANPSKYINISIF